MKLVKIRKIVFNRVDDDEFIVALCDEDENILVTMEPREIDVDRAYVLDFGHDIVVAQQDFGPLV
jgi:hypothetical protein